MFEKILMLLVFVVVYTFSVFTIEKYSYHSGYADAQIANSNLIPAEFCSKEFSDWLWIPTSNN